MRYDIRWVFLMAAACVGGCNELSFGPARPAGAPAGQPVARPADRADYIGASVVQRTDRSPGQGAVDVALEWSNKYAKTAEELLACQKANKQLTAENGKLQAQSAEQRTQLAQARKELAEANEMLVDLGQQLQEWKKNVLGFRTEMQQAQQVQLDAIKRVMVLLGGEVGRPKAAADAAVSAKDQTREMPDGSNG